jgi:exodeoxyribonuclease-3
MRIVSWNVNGLRACVRKGFVDWLRGARADVVLLQEVRALEEELPEEVRALRKRWKMVFSAAERRGYSGVAILSRREPDSVEMALGEPRFDCEGRLLTARFGRLVVINGYFPKGSGTERDNSRVPYKLAFYASVFKQAAKLRKRGDRVLVAGDFNTAHTEIDLARPKENVANSGFLPEERAELQRWIDAGWVDTFRHFHPDQGGHYTWWSQRSGARQRNIGWRIDYVLACPAAMKFVKKAFLSPNVTASDHCPVGVDLDDRVVDGD